MRTYRTTLKREGGIIREKGALNKVISGRTRKEYYESDKYKIKESYENNKDKIKDKYEKYYENDKDIFYYNRREHIEYMKDYKTFHEDNKKMIKAYRNQKKSHGRKG